LDPYPDKPRITFKADGTFKLTVFSDLHFGENPWYDWGPEQDRNSVVLLEKILADEKPDFAYVVFPKTKRVVSLQFHQASLTEIWLLEKVSKNIPLNRTCPH